MVKAKSISYTRTTYIELYSIVSIKNTKSWSYKGEAKESRDQKYKENYYKSYWAVNS